MFNWWSSYPHRSTGETTVTLLSLMLTYAQAKLMTSILQAQIEAVVLAANNSLFSRHPRGSEGGREGGRGAGGIGVFILS